MLLDAANYVFDQAVDVKRKKTEQKQQQICMHKQTNLKRIKQEKRNLNRIILYC